MLHINWCMKTTVKVLDKTYLWVPRADIHICFMDRCFEFVRSHVSFILIISHSVECLPAQGTVSDITLTPESVVSEAGFLLLILRLLPSRLLRLRLSYPENEGQTIKSEPTNPKIYKKNSQTRLTCNWILRIWIIRKGFTFRKVTTWFRSIREVVNIAAISRKRTKNILLLFRIPRGIRSFRLVRMRNTCNTNNRY